MKIKKNKKPNIVLITIDSLRSDHCSFLGYNRNTTPFLDSIKNESIVFTNFYANSIPTFFAFPVLMSGLKPFTYGYVLGVPAGIETLAEKLKRLGYYTCAFISNNYALYPEFGYARGFDFYEVFHDLARVKFNRSKKSKKNKFKKLIQEILPDFVLEIYKKKKFHLASIIPSGEELVDYVIDHLSNSSVKTNSIFCWVHFMDSHNTYTSGLELYKSTAKQNISISEIKKALFYYSCALSKYYSGDSTYHEVLTKVNFQLIKELYDASIRYVDDCLYVLFEQLSAILNDETIYIVTSDHGEAFFEHGYGYHEPYGLHNELIKVPLLIHYTQNKINKIISPNLSHLNLSYLILKLINDGIEVVDYVKHISQNIVVGEIPYRCKAPHFNIRDTETPLGNYTLRAYVIKDTWKLIFDIGGEYAELFNLEDDPYEQNNLVELYLNKASELKKIYFDWSEERNKIRYKLKRKNLIRKLKNLK